MNAKIWKSSDDGKLDFISLTPEYLDESLEVLKRSFYCFEEVSIAIGLPGNEAAISELDELLLRTAFDGVSVIAIERNSNKVCGVAFNKIHVLDNPDDATYFGDYIKTCKESSARSMLQFMDELEAHFDFFGHCKVDCVMEIVFLATLPECMKRGIARNLCEASLELSKELGMGNNIKTPLDRRDLLLGPKPQVVTAIFTSPFSQRIGRALKWEIASTMSYDDFCHQGKTFSSILGGDKKYMTFEFKRIAEVDD